MRVLIFASLAKITFFWGGCVTGKAHRYKTIDITYMIEALFRKLFMMDIIGREIYTILFFLFIIYSVYISFSLFLINSNL